MKMVHLKIEDQLAIMTLDNPPQNRLVPQVKQDFEEALNAVSSSDARALIIRAEGPDFSYGGYFPIWIGKSGDDLQPGFERSLPMYNRLERLPIPVIAAVRGVCWGGGFEIALRCDMILATPDANFNHPEKTLGITTLLGGVYRLAERAGRNVAAELAYMAEPMGAERMYQLGVVNRIIPGEKLDEEALVLGRSLADGPTKAHAAHKTLLRLWAVSGVQAADEALIDLSMPLFDTEDTARGLESAAKALAEGKPRPILKFQGR